MKSRLLIRRVYEKPGPEDGVRVLVDRIWPRGVSKAEAGIDHWLKELAPSTPLRKWFGHDPKKWPEFERRYAAELKEADRAVGLEELRKLMRSGRVTLVYGARDESHNNAVALKRYLEKR